MRHVARVLEQMDGVEHGIGQIELRQLAQQGRAVLLTDRRLAAGEEADALDVGKRRQHAQLGQRSHAAPAVSRPDEIGPQKQDPHGDDAAGRGLNGH